MPASDTASQPVFCRKAKAAKNGLTRSAREADVIILMDNFCTLVLYVLLNSVLSPCVRIVLVLYPVLALSFIAKICTLGYIFSGLSIA